jgi:hypothetical protein
MSTEYGVEGPVFYEIITFDLLILIKARLARPRNRNYVLRTEYGVILKNKGVSPNSSELWSTMYRVLISTS